MAMNEQEEKVLVQTMKQYRRKTRAFYTCLLLGVILSGYNKGLDWPTVVFISGLYATYAGLISVEKIANLWLKKGAS
jgi:hypothetical protein